MYTLMILNVDIVLGYAFTSFWEEINVFRCYLNQGCLSFSDTKGTVVGFYVRSSLHSCETSVDIYFAVPPYMSVYFLVMYVMHNYLDLKYDFFDI